jgi:hypothetical protein
MSEMDQDLAASYVGKHILVGLTYLDHNEQLIEQIQYHGRIVRINDHDGIVIKVNGTDEERALPPALESIEVAKEGEYTLRSTGEVIINPDLTTSWTSVKEAPENEAPA